MNPFDETGLPYVSSAPDFLNVDPVETVKPQDEEDLPTINRMFKLIQAQKAIYQSTSYFTLGEVTLENQLIIATQMQKKLQELEQLLIGTLTKIQEKRLGL